MTRIECIERLKAQYALLVRLGKRKRANIVQAKLQSLMTRQIKSEKTREKAA